MKKESYIQEIKKIKTDETYYDHLVVGLEHDIAGIPIGTMIKASGNPLQMIGMIDILIRKLEDMKESIHQRIENVESVSKALKDLPSDIMNKINDWEEKAREAAEKGDRDIIKELQDLLKKELGLDKPEDIDDDEDSDTDLDIDDLKSL